MMHALRIKFSFVSICSGRFLKHSLVVLSGPPFFWFCWCWIDLVSSSISMANGAWWLFVTDGGSICCSIWVRVGSVCGLVPL